MSNEQDPIADFREQFTSEALQKECGLPRENTMQICTLTGLDDTTYPTGEAIFPCGRDRLGCFYTDQQIHLPRPLPESLCLLHQDGTQTFLDDFYLCQDRTPRHYHFRMHPAK